jgi:hypothetical protein
MLLPNSYTAVVWSFVSLTIIFLFVYPYIQAETLTNLNQNSLDVAKICRTEKEKDFNYLKIISFERQKNTAMVYCIYNDYNKNSVVTLFNSENTWQVEFTRNYKKDILIFWPIYY